MADDKIQQASSGHKRLMITLIVIIVIVAASGFFMGLNQTRADAASREDSQWETNFATSPHRDYSELSVIPSYNEQADINWKTNDELDGHFTRLHTLDTPRTPTSAIRPEELTAALNARQARRAFDTAPPVVPHAIDELDPRACLTCHSPGNARKIGERVTPTISHPYLQNCTQCHVPESGLHEIVKTESDTGIALSLGNAFTGQEPVQHGDTAYEGAPPVLPHPVWMRQNCLACHGEGRPSAIRTSHPQRQNCLQCHAPNHLFDNRERLINAFPDFTPIPLPTPEKQTTSEPTTE